MLPASSNVLELTAAFIPTVAFYVEAVLRSTNSTHSSDSSSTWSAAVQVMTADSTCLSCMMRDQQQLAQMMHIGNQDIVSSLPLAVHPQLIPTVFIGMSTAVRPILLLLHLLHDQSNLDMLEWAKEGPPYSMTKDAEFAVCAQAASSCSSDCNTATEADAPLCGHHHSQDEEECSRKGLILHCCAALCSS